MKLQPVPIGSDRQGQPAFFEWRNRVVRVTGGLDSGKTVFTSRFLQHVDADILTFISRDSDVPSFPGCFQRENLGAFHEALVEKVRVRLQVASPRPLFVLLDKWAAAESALDDVLRVARHASALNAYVMLEDRNRAKGPFRRDFADLRSTTVTLTRHEGLVQYSRDSDLLRFIPEPVTI